MLIMNKVMVTGATGDVGKSLCEILDKMGYDVITSSRKKPKDWKYPFIPLDITDLFRDLYQTFFHQNT